jgi:hypothetical protein
MNKTATHLQLIGYAIGILLTLITSYVILTNRVTALETNQKNQDNINNRIEEKLDKLIDNLIK